MKLSNRLLFPVFLAALVLLGFVAITHADARGQGNEGRSDDAIARQDRDLYQRLNIEKKFGVHFRSHTRVCDNAGAGEAACAARVVVDEQGTPNASPKVISGYGPAQFLKAYGLSPTAPGTKPSIIAIVDAYNDPNIQSDLNTYSAAFGIPILPACSGAIA